jgi:hypothetical protein
MVSVEIDRIEDEPECRVHEEPREGLATAPSAAKLWTEITPLERRDWIQWLSSAKPPETHQSRMAKSRCLLPAGMPLNYGFGSFPPPIATGTETSACQNSPLGTASQAWLLSTLQSTQPDSNRKEV